jgi:hypothetical protein
MDNLEQLLIRLERNASSVCEQNSVVKRLLTPHEVHQVAGGGLFSDDDILGYKQGLGDPPGYNQSSGYCQGPGGYTQGVGSPPYTQNGGTYNQTGGGGYTMSCPPPPPPK